MPTSDDDRCTIATALPQWIASAGTDAEKLLVLAELAFRTGFPEQALSLKRKAESLGADVDSSGLSRRIANSMVPDWHFTIVRDLKRNAAFDLALRRQVTASTRVLDIGAGSGLLSLMAAKAGAAVPEKLQPGGRSYQRAATAR